MSLENSTVNQSVVQFLNDKAEAAQLKEN